MCGILCVIQDESCQCDLETIRERLISLLKNRGPDRQGNLAIKENGLRFQLYSSLLWLRGSMPHVQPDESEHGILLWNGDTYDDRIPNGMSDTAYISDALSRAEDKKSVFDTFKLLKGPGAFVYYNRRLQMFFFGRDLFGRHSLLASRRSCHLVISSVGFSGSTLVEVPAVGYYSCDISARQVGDIVLTPWSNRMVKDFPFDFRLCSDQVLEPATNTKLSREIRPSFLDIESYLGCETAISAMTELHRALEKAVRERLGAQPPFCKECIGREFSNDGRKSTTEGCQHSKVAVLFSGGLDSMILAHLAALSLKSGESIDLINVAFQQQDGTFDVPDRITGLQGFKEMLPLLQDLSITLNLVLVDVNRAELQALRQAQIRDLLYPLETVLDDSIGCAIWFAARGQGRLWTEDEGSCRSYHSPARVLLLGMGADEQLGGYSKHKAAFVHSSDDEGGGGGRESLLQELQRQMDAISERNLGRDNRIVSDHGVAGRFPYLAEDVVGVLAKLPLELKMNLALDRGLGDKMILRALAHWLGLRKTAREPKRAIQFGSRIAKLENRKEKASDKAIR